MPDSLRPTRTRRGHAERHPQPVAEVDILNSSPPTRRAKVVDLCCHPPGNPLRRTAPPEPSPPRGPDRTPALHSCRQLASLEGGQLVHPISAAPAPLPSPSATHWHLVGPLHPRAPLPPLALVLSIRPRLHSHRRPLPPPYPPPHCILFGDPGG